MSALRESLGFLTSRLRQVGIFVALILIVILFQILTDGILLQPQNVTNLVVQNSYILILAIGMVMVIIAGHIDLSVPWTLAAAAMMATAVGGPMAIPVGIGIGLAVGIFNGIGVAYLRVPSMIFTLGVNAMLRGLMVMHTGGFAPQTHATDLHDDVPQHDVDDGATDGGNHGELLRTAPI